MITQEQILKRMDTAIRQDRERFFKVADTLHLQPKYAENLEDLETIKQIFRDLPSVEGYPNIDWPPALPEWFPKIFFASSFKKDEYIAETLKEANRHEPE